MVAGAGSARAGYSYSGGVGNIGDNGSTFADGNLGAGVGDYGYSEITGDGFYAIEVEIDTQNQRILEYDGDRFQAIIGQGRAGGEVTVCEGNWQNSGIEPIATINFGTADNRNSQEFTVTDNPLPFSLTLSFEGAMDGAIVYLDRQDGGSWVIDSIYSSSSTPNGTVETFALPPGLYRMRGECSGGLSCITTQGLNSYSYELRRTDIVNQSPLTYGEYTYPEIYTTFRNPDALSLTNIRILDEIPDNDGNPVFRVQADLSNDSFCPWREIVLGVDPDRAILNAVEELDDVTFAEVDANATAIAGPNDIVFLRCPPTTAAAVRQQIEDGSLFSLTGRELVMFNLPVTFFEPSDIALWQEGSMQLEFDAEPSAQPGTLWLRNPLAGPAFIARQGSDGPERYTGPLESPTPEAPVLRLPYLVTSTEETTGAGGADVWRVNGRSASLADHIIHGTYTSGVKAILGPDGQAVTDDLFAGVPMLPLSKPIHFNRLKIPLGEVKDRLFLSGTFSFIPKGFDVSMRFDFFQPTSVIVDSGFKGSAHLLVEIEDNFDNSNAPFAETEKELLDLLLFSVELPGGFRFEPRFALKAGAVVDSPSGLTIPASSIFDLDIRAGQINGQPFFETDGTVDSLETSAPEIFSGASASVEGWIQSELKLLLSYQGAFTAGPTVASRLTVDFTADEAGDPWWQTSAEFDLRLGGQVATLPEIGPTLDHEEVLTTFPLYNSAATGAFDADPKPDGTVMPPGICTVSDPAAGFARIMRPQGTTGLTNPFATNLTDGTKDYLAGYQGTFTSHYSRYNQFGAVLWSKEADFVILDAVGEADGGAILLGFGRLLKVDAMGDIVWDKPFTASESFSARSMVADAASIYVLGRVIDGPNNRFIGGVIKFGRDGEPVWAKTHAAQHYNGGTPNLNDGDMIITNDGHLAICRTGSMDVDPTIGTMPQFIRDSESFNSGDNGVLMKLDSATGAPIWSTLIAHAAGVSYRALAQDPDGNYYIGGRLLSDGTLPSNLIVKVDVDGNALDGTLLGHFDQGTSSPLFGNLPNGGQTPFDEIYDLVWTGDRLWMTGYIGISTQGGGSISSAAIDSSLNATRYAIHEAPGNEYGYRILARPTGPMIVGTSDSFLPWPQGVDSPANSNAEALMMLQLPWEGKVNFHSISAAAQPDNTFGEPDSGAWFIYPQQVSLVNRSAVSNASFFAKNYTVWATQPTMVDSNTFTVSPSSGFVTASNHPVETLLAVEYLPESLITDADTWARYYQIGDDEDVDADGHTQREEFYYGLDPIAFDRPVADLGMSSTIDGDFVEITFPRRAGVSLLPELQEGNLFDPWETVLGPGVSIDPLPDGRDEITLTVPRTDVRRFYQLIAPAE